MAELFSSYNVLFLVFIFTCITSISSSSFEGQLNCPNKTQCIPLTKCSSIHNRENYRKIKIFLTLCHEGLNMVCCPQSSIMQNTKITIQNSKMSLFPLTCGVAEPINKITGGRTAEVGQFPWMALLGYKSKHGEDISFLCGGSLITERYILTAAHCLVSNNNVELYKVRLGEHNLTKTEKCFVSTDSQTCADPPMDYLVDHTLKHQQYDTQKLYNDIALVKVKQKIKFTDNIKPICLPFERELEGRNLIKQKFTVSGWGKTNYKSPKQSMTLQYAEVTVWDQLICANNVPVSAKPLTEKQLCANGPLKEDACLGDSGGPLIHYSVDFDRELRYYQVGIVSYTSTPICGDPSLPTVYTRMDQYLTWIQDNIS